LQGGCYPTANYIDEFGEHYFFEVIVVISIDFTETPRFENKKLHERVLQIM